MYHSDRCERTWLVDENRPCGRLGVRIGDVETDLVRLNLAAVCPKAFGHHGKHLIGFPEAGCRLAAVPGRFHTPRPIRDWWQQAFGMIDLRRLEV